MKTFNVTWTSTQTNLGTPVTRVTKTKQATSIDAINFVKKFHGSLVVEILYGKEVG